MLVSSSFQYVLSALPNMVLSDINDADCEIVGVLPTLCLRVLLEPFHATLDENAVRVFERPEFAKDIKQRQRFESFAVGCLLRVGEGIEAVGCNRDRKSTRLNSSHRT